MLCNGATIYTPLQQEHRWAEFVLMTGEEGALNESGLGDGTTVLMVRGIDLKLFRTLCSQVETTLSRAFPGVYFSCTVPIPDHPPHCASFPRGIAVALETDQTSTWMSGKIKVKGLVRTFALSDLLGSCAPSRGTLPDPAPPVPTPAPAPQMRHAASLAATPSTSPPVPMNKADWVPDKDATRCQNSECRKPFVFLRRKHHCRHCGRVFCDACTQNRYRYPGAEVQEPQRVCQVCFVALVTAAQPPIAATVSGPTPATARLALVIGNDNYDERSGFHPLSKCMNDAHGMATILREMNFDHVTAVVNANNKELRDALYALVEKIQDHCIVVFFFSGHGQGFGNSSYLVPTGLTNPLERQDDFDHDCINLNDVFATFNRASSTCTFCLFFDCCRSDPKNSAFKGFVGSGGFLKGPCATPTTHLTSQKPSMAIGYATAPGTVATQVGGGEHSPYTRALMRHLPTRRKDLRQLHAAITSDVMHMTQRQQQPWLEASLLQEEFVL